MVEITADRYQISKLIWHAHLLCFWIKTSKIRLTLHLHPCSASGLRMNIHALCISIKDDITLALNTKIRLTYTPASLLCFQIKDFCFQIKDLTYTPPVINKISKKMKAKDFIFHFFHNTASIQQTIPHFIYLFGLVSVGCARPFPTLFIYLVLSRWGAPGWCCSATHKRRPRAPIASYCKWALPLEKYI